MVYDRADRLDFRLAELPALPAPGRVLMTTPAHFDVEYVINPHMAGHVGAVDRVEARAQWEALRDTYTGLGLDVAVLDGAPGQPDMVFCANQTLPYLRGDRPGVVLSRMHAAERKGEVAHYAQFFEAEGYETTPLAGVTTDFEGMGDALWHVGRRLLWGGHGFRTGLDAYRALSEALAVPVVALHLADPDFYHLDTCLSLLDERTALYFPGAFDADGLGLLRALFDRLIEAPEDEARRLFACNAHCPDGRNVLVQRGCDVTAERLRDAGFEPLELETGEFLKSGGSVFCMKLAYW